MRITALDLSLGWCSLNHVASLNRGLAVPLAPSSLGAGWGGTEVEDRADYLGVPFLLLLLPRPSKDLFRPLGKGEGEKKSRNSNYGSAQCT